MVLQIINPLHVLAKNEYMAMKRELADGIMEKIFADVPTDC